MKNIFAENKKMCNVEIYDHNPNKVKDYNLKCYKENVDCENFSFLFGCKEEIYKKCKYNLGTDERDFIKFTECEKELTGTSCFINIRGSAYGYFDYKGINGYSDKKGYKTLLKENGFNCNETISIYKSCMESCKEGDWGRSEISTYFLGANKKEAKEQDCDNYCNKTPKYHKDN